MTRAPAGEEALAKTSATPELPPSLPAIGERIPAPPVPPPPVAPQWQNAPGSPPAPAADAGSAIGPRPTRRPLVIGGAAGAALVIVAVLLFLLLRPGGSPVIHPAGHDLTITVDLLNPSSGFSGSGCDVSGTGYDDLSPGHPVTVKDAKGIVIASGVLPTGNDSGGSDCKFTLTLHVPDTSFYQVEVSQRGVVTFTKEQLVTSNWIAALSIGSG